MSIPTTDESQTQNHPTPVPNPPSTPQDEADVRWIANVRTAADAGLEKYGPIKDQRDALARLLELATKIARTYAENPDASPEATIHRRWRNVAGLALMFADIYGIHGHLDGSNP